MKKTALEWLLLLALPFVTPAIRAAATLQGLVVIDRGRGQPAVEASVNADGVVAGKANQTSTISNGSFRLVFPAGRLEQEVRPAVNLRGRYRDGVVVRGVLLDSTESRMEQVRVACEESQGRRRGSRTGSEAFAAFGRHTRFG